MEFDATVLGQNYRFSFINDNSVLVSGKNVEYILYKKKVWLCADEIAMRLLEQFGKVLNERLTPVH
jgi:hypothetical protein